MKRRWPKEERKGRYSVTWWCIQPWRFLMKLFWYRALIFEIPLLITFLVFRHALCSSWLHYSIQWKTTAWSFFWPEGVSSTIDHDDADCCCWLLTDTSHWLVVRLIVLLQYFNYWLLIFFCCPRGCPQLPTHSSTSREEGDTFIQWYNYIIYSLTFVILTRLLAVFIVVVLIDWCSTGWPSGVFHSGDDDILRYVKVTWRRWPTWFLRFLFPFTGEYSVFRPINYSDQWFEPYFIDQRHLLRRHSVLFPVHWVVFHILLTFHSVWCELTFDVKVTVQEIQYYSAIG